MPDESPASCPPQTRQSRPKDHTLNLARRLFEANGVSQHVEASTVDRLLAGARVHAYPRGSSLFRLGDTVTHLLVFLTGTIEVSLQDADGGRAVCWYMGPGHWLGLIAVIDGKGSPHDYRATEDVTALAIPRDLFLEAMAADPKLSRLCLRILCKRTRALFGHQAAEILLTLRVKIVRLLLLLHDQWHAQSPDGHEIGMKLSQEDFAAMLGVTRQSINRELHALEAEGLISLAYSRIRLRDLPALRATASRAVWTTTGVDSLGQRDDRSSAAIPSSR